MKWEWVSFRGWLRTEYIACMLWDLPHEYLRYHCLWRISSTFEFVCKSTTCNYILKVSICLRRDHKQLFNKRAAFFHTQHKLAFASSFTISEIFASVFYTLGKDGFFLNLILGKLSNMTKYITYEHNFGLLRPMVNVTSH